MFYVAFEHIAGIYEGARFWCQYATEEAFHASGVNAAHRVVACGGDKDEIQRIALDYPPTKHLDIALGKTEERRQKALSAFRQHGDRKRYTQELRRVEELHKFELINAALAAQCHN